VNAEQKRLIEERAILRKGLGALAVELEEKQQKVEDMKARLEAAREEARELRKNIPMVKSEVYSIQRNIDRDMREFALLTFKIEGIEGIELEEKK
jgi:chromosome segregation ATPase